MNKTKQYCFVSQLLLADWPLPNIGQDHRYRHRQTLLVSRLFGASRIVLRWATVNAQLASWLKNSREQTAGCWGVGPHLQVQLPGAGVPTEDRGRWGSGWFATCQVAKGTQHHLSGSLLKPVSRASPGAWCWPRKAGRGRVGPGRAASLGGSGLPAVRGAGLWPRTSALNGDHVKCVPAQRVLVGLYFPGGGSSQGPDLPAALWVTSTCLKQVMLPNQADNDDDKESTL